MWYAASHPGTRLSILETNALAANADGGEPGVHTRRRAREGCGVCRSKTRMRERCVIVIHTYTACFDFFQRVCGTGMRAIRSCLCGATALPICAIRVFVLVDALFMYFNTAHHHEMR